MYQMWKFPTDDHGDESYRNHAIILVNGKKTYMSLTTLRNPRWEY